MFVSNMDQVVKLVDASIRWLIPLAVLKRTQGCWVIEVALFPVDFRCSLFV